MTQAEHHQTIEPPRLSRGFLRDGARAKYSGNDEQLQAVSHRYDVELTPQVMRQVEQTIKDSKRSHTENYRHTQAQRAEAQQRAAKHFAFALGSLALLIGGLAAGRLFFFAPIGVIVFLIMGAMALLDTPSEMPLEFTKNDIR